MRAALVIAATLCAVACRGARAPRVEAPVDVPACAGAPPAAPPEERPSQRIDALPAQVWGLAFSKTGWLAVTSSDAHVAVWSARDRHLVSRVRGDGYPKVGWDESGEKIVLGSDANEYRVFGADGRPIGAPMKREALAGAGFRVDRAESREHARLAPLFAALPPGATGEASEDGRFFAAGSADDDGRGVVHLWEVAGARRVATITRANVTCDNPRADPPDKFCFKMALGGTPPRLAVTFDAREVTLYDAATGRRQGTLGAAAAREPRRLRFVGDDVLATIGDGRVAFWSLRDGSMRAEGEASGVVDVARSGDGAKVARVASDETQGFVDEWAGLDPPLRGEAFAPGAGLIVLGFDLAHSRAIVGREVKGEPEPRDVAVVDLASGKRTPLESSRNGTTVPGFPSADGRRYVRAGADDGLAVVWDATTGKVVWQREKDPAPLSAARAAVSRDGSRVAYWAHDNAVHVFGVDDGSALAIPRMTSEGLAFLADGTLLVGSFDGELAAYRGATKVASAATAGGSIEEIAVAPDGRLVATRSADGAVRVLSADGLRPLVTLVDYADGEHVAFTPAGAYAGTPEVASRVGWVFRAPAERFAFEQFARTYARPEIVARRLAGEAVDAPAAAARPPRATILSATARPDAPAAVVRVRARSGSRVDQVRVFVEGRLAATRSVCAPEAEVEVNVPLLAGKSRVTAVAYDAAGLASNADSADVEDIARRGRRPRLGIVTVGVDRYPHFGADEQLAFAAADARAVADAFRAQSSAAYASLVVDRVLTNEAATPAAIDGALGELAALEPEDAAVVFLAGHGFKPSAGEDMVFVTSAASKTRASLVQWGVSWRSAVERLARVKGRVLVILDACHSGHWNRDLVVPNSALAAELAASQRAGVTVFAASKGRQVSYEPGGGPRGLVFDAKEARRAAWRRADREGHGVFTAALLDALDDERTDADASGGIEATELFDAVSARVGEITGGRQTPWVARRETVGDWRIAVRRVRD